MTKITRARGKARFIENRLNKMGVELKHVEGSIGFKKPDIKKKFLVAAYPNRLNLFEDLFEYVNKNVI